MKARNVVIIAVMLCLSFVGSGFGVYKYSEIKNYNTLIKQANLCMQSGDYDKAVALFKESLNYKKSADAQASIMIAEKLKNDKSYYTEGIKLLNDKKYLEALVSFNKIESANSQFADLNDKIQLCKTQYIAKNTSLANDSARNGNYQDANKYLDEILKIDANNDDVKKLKDKFASAAKEQQNAEIEKVEQSKSQLKDTSPQSGNSNAIASGSRYDSDYLKVLAENNKIQIQINDLEIRKQSLSKYSDEYINLLKEKSNLTKQQINNLKNYTQTHKP